MTASTLRQVEGFVQVKSLGAVQVKGVSRPVEAFEVVAATTARTRVQAGGCARADAVSWAPERNRSFQQTR